jgi:hypothetical protein
MRMRVLDASLREDSRRVPAPKSYGGAVSGGSSKPS